MKKKIILFLLLFTIISILTGCINNKKTEENEAIKEMKVIINNEEYTINLEDNKTAKKLVELAPLEVTMKELNGNEKYIYLENNLPVDSYKPGHIEKGDVMLFNDNCIVIFYKSFDTEYGYTKIGHIDNLPDLGNQDIIARFEK